MLVSPCRAADRVARRRCGALAWAAVLASVALGCHSAPSPSFIDVTIDVDPALDIDRVAVTASAPGKANFVQDFAPASIIQTSFQPTGLADGARIRIEARGTKSVSAVVLVRGDVPLRIGHHATLTLHITADCAGIVSCSDNETCERGRCIPVPTSEQDGGVADGPAVGTGGVGGVGTGGVSGTGGGAAGVGGIPGTGGGAGGAAGFGSGGVAGRGGGAGGRAGSGGGVAGRTGSGGVQGSGGAPGTGGAPGPGGAPGSGGAPGTGGASTGGANGTGGKGTAGVGGSVGVGGMPPPAPINVLVWNTATAFGHQSRASAIPLLQAREATNNIKFDVRYAHTDVATAGTNDATSDPSVFTDAGLQPYDVVLFLNTSGTTLDQDGQATVHRQALIDFIKKGRGFVGTHSAADTYQGTAWAWYVDFLGANMAGHANANTQGTARYYMGKTHAILMAANTPDPWDRKEEWLTFTRDLRASADPGITVLQTCTDTQLTTERPITWVHQMPLEAGAPRAGRMFYTGHGHLVGAFEEPAVMDLIIAGIKWAANRL